MLLFLRRLLKPKSASKTIRRGRITAAEYIRQTESDPVHQARMREATAKREALRQRCEEDEKGLVRELRELGLPIASVYDLVNNKPNPVVPTKFVGPYQVAYPVLLRHLDEFHEPNVREGIIRALIVRDLPRQYHQRLLEQLRSETNRIHRVCLALACRRALGRRRAAQFPEIEAAIRGGMLEPLSKEAPGEA
jgi:hypothetical protein